MSGLGANARIENLSERRELSEAAKALLADKAFGHVYRDLYERWYAQLLDAPPASPLQIDLVARLRTLELMLVELGLLLTNYRADAKAARNG
jgi:hypothetical protein